jgi:hypothetical protein
MMPPPGHPQLTAEELLTFARWIDLYMPINHATAKGATHGWFLDEQRPALHISQPRPNLNRTPITMLRVSFADGYTGIMANALSVTMDTPIDGIAAGTELSGRGTVSDGIWTMTLATPITSLSTARLTARVRDVQGNWSESVVRFSVTSDTPPPVPVPPSVLQYLDARGVTATALTTQQTAAQVLLTTLVTAANPVAVVDVPERGVRVTVVWQAETVLVSPLP